MPTLLAIGTDREWLSLVGGACPELVVERFDSVPEAVAKASQRTVEPTLVILDASCCTPRSGPALRILRSLVRARFLIVFDPPAERLARTLPCDLLVAKLESEAALRRELRGR